MTSEEQFCREYARANSNGHIDYSTNGGITWNMWCYNNHYLTADGVVVSTIDRLIDIWYRLPKLYPEWQFRLIIGKGL